MGSITVTRAVAAHNGKKGPAFSVPFRNGTARSVINSASYYCFVDAPDAVGLYTSRYRREIRNPINRIAAAGAGKLPFRMPLVLDSSVSPSDDAVFRELEGESVLLNLETGMYYGLDEVGTRAWQLAAADGSLRAVRDALAEEYDAEPAVIEHDLLTLAEALIGKGLWTLK